MSLKRFLSTLALSFVFIFSLNAQDIDALKTTAEKAFMNAKYEEAASAYKQLIDANSGDSTERSMFYAYAGLSCEKLNQNEEALTYFKQAVMLKVPRVMIYDKLVSLAKAKQDDATYEFALLKKEKAFPDYEASVEQSLASYYYITKSYEKLLKSTDKLTQWYPDNTKYHLYAAVAKQNLGDNDGAKEAYLEVLKINPADAGANMGVGMIFYKRAKAQYDKMKTNYESIANPTRVQYSEYHKKLEKPQAKYKEALPYLLKAYENKSYASLKGVIRSSYLRIGEIETADNYK